MLAGAAVHLIAACSAAPDASRFAAAGTQLHSAVVTTGEMVAGELNRAKLLREADALSTLWTVPDACTVAMMRYGDALADIVMASRGSGEAAQAVANAGASFATSVGAVLPPALAASESAKLIGTLVQQAANEHAARSLEDALAGMQPTVDAVAVLLGKQLDDAGKILLDASGHIDLDMTKRYQFELGYSKTLKADRQALYYKPRTAETTRKLDDIVHREQVIAPTLQQYAQEQSALEQRTKLQQELLDAAGRAVMEWAAAHRQLLTAVQNRAPIDPQGLNESIIEQRALIRKARTT